VKGLRDGGLNRRKLRRSRKRDFLTLFIGLFIIFCIVSYFYLYSRSKSPKFCLSCHYEKPYYKHWKTSTHNKVSCYKCHPNIPLKMFTMVVKYNLGMYDMFPRANVTTNTCLQSGCHDRKELFSEKLVVKDKPVFNHKQHLSAPLRGVELRCSSCHSHIVQGMHVSVEETVCFTCHFMGAGKGQSVTGCPSCHGPPTKEVQFHGFKFRHQEYLKLGVSCDQCHVEIVKGDGSVPKEKCHLCHVERKMPRDPKVTHRIHVKEQGIDCFVCHTRIKHGSIKLVKTFLVKCADCHTRFHNAKKALYMGVGGRGMGDLPSRMFAAQVTCDGCHIKSLKVPGGFQGETTKVSSPQSCVRCHEEGFDLLLKDWEKYLKSLEGYVGHRLRRDYRLKPRLKGDLARLFDDADYNYKFVMAGNGVHNVEYAVKLLKIAVDNLDKVDEAQRSYIPPRPPIIATPDGYCAVMCHNRMGMPEDIYFQQKLVFPHKLHAQKEKIPCMRCHSVEHHGVTVLKREDCLKCHHQMKDATRRCTRCHALENAFYHGSIKGLPKGDANPMVEGEVGCVDCHDVTETVKVSYKEVRQNCVDCHDGDESYGEALDEWKDQIKELTDKINARMARITKVLQEVKLGPKGEAAVRVHYSKALKVKKVLQGLAPIHNVDYAQGLFDMASKELDAIEEMVKKAKGSST